MKAFLIERVPILSGIDEDFRLGLIKQLKDQIENHQNQQVSEGYNDFNDLVV